jgi:hypothetical protein
LRGVDASGRGQLGDGLVGETSHGQAPDRRVGGQLAQHPPEGVAAVKFVFAVTGDYEHGPSGNSAYQQPEHVKGGLVRPVQVFQYENSRPVGGQQPEQPRGYLVGHRRAPLMVLKLAAAGLGER